MVEPELDPLPIDPLDDPLPDDPLPIESLEVPLWPELFLCFLCLVVVLPD